MPSRSKVSRRIAVEPPQQMAEFSSRNDAMNEFHEERATDASPSPGTYQRYPVTAPTSAFELSSAPTSVHSQSRDGRPSESANTNISERGRDSRTACRSLVTFSPSSSRGATVSILRLERRHAEDTEEDALFPLSSASLRWVCSPASR